tara:strand:- start:313 stop:609 length:297 start_codon:yes stop_codon:yes gene_type:complete
MSQNPNEILLSLLATFPWFDISEASPDPDAVETWGCGFGDKVYILPRYEDEVRFALVVQVADGDPNDFLAVTKEQFQIEWLWEHVSAKSPAEPIGHEV